MRRHRPEEHSSASAGFTLLEMLITLSLLAVMTTMILGSLSFGRRAWERAEEVEQHSAAAAAQSLLRQILTEAVPGGRVDSSGRRAVVFEGKADSLTVLTNMQGKTTRGGLYVAQVAAGPAPATGGHALLLTLQIYRPADAGQIIALRAKPEVKVLTDNAARVSFRYFGSKQLSGRTDWHDEWVGVEQLPELIEVSVQLGAAVTWPRLVAAPALR